MPIIVTKTVKQLAKEKGKQVTPEFLVALDKKMLEVVAAKMDKSHVKRLKACDAQY